MSMGLDSPYVSLLLWSFLPRVIANKLHGWYYDYKYSRNSPSRPHPTSKKYQTHNNRIYTLIVCSYLIYTLFQFIFAMPPNHYQALSLSPSRTFTDRELKTVFRKASLQYHPDKNEEEGSVERFMEMRSAYEVLQDSDRRFAYDRYGEEVATCKHCRRRADFVELGVEGVKYFYFGTTVVLVLINISGKGQFGRYWRFVATAFLAGLELAMLTRPRNPLGPIASILLSDFTIHEQIQLLHNTFFAFFIALSQVGPIYFPQEERTTRQLLERLQSVTHLAHMQSVHSFKSMFEPFADKELETVLRRRMEKIAVESKLNEDKDVVATKLRARGKLAKTK